MKPFWNYVHDELNLKVPEGPTISSEWFAKNHLPMIVRCTCCEMTMATPSAWITDDGECLCADCAGVTD